MMKVLSQKDDYKLSALEIDLNNYDVIVVSLDLIFMQGYEIEIHYHCIILSFTKYI